jgi:hypothetical protein
MKIDRSIINLFCAPIAAGTSAHNPTIAHPAAGATKRNCKMKKLSVVILGILALALGTNALAAPFTSGNIVVQRFGDGTTTLTSTSVAEFLDEYTTNGTTAVQSIALPTTTTIAGSVTNYPLTAAGSATGDGMAQLSTNSLYLLITGFGTNTGVITVNSVATARRVVGIAKADGTIDTTTAIVNDPAGSTRGVASVDGTNLYACGGTSGVRYFTNSQSTASVQLSTSPVNTRGLGVFNGQLYVSSGSGAFRLATVGTGTPTSSGQTIVNLNGMDTSGGSPYGFVMFKLHTGGADDPDTVYICDDSGATTATAGIRKWSLVGTLWTLNGRYLAPGAHHVTGRLRVVGVVTNADLWAVTATGAGASAIISATDNTGYNAAPSPTTVTTNATAGANTKWQGIAFVPSAAGCPNPSCSISGPTTVCATKTNTYTVSGSGGAAPYTFAWSLSSDDSSTFRAGGTTASGSTTQVVAGSAGSYTLTIVPTDNNGCVGSPSCTYPVTVTTSVLPAVTLTCNTTNICAGTSVTFTATPTAAPGGSPTYAFYLNDPTATGDPAQSGSSTTYGPTTTLANGDTVVVYMTSTDDCRSQDTVNSSTITMVVETAPVGGTTTGVAPVCPGGSVTISRSGQTGTVVWQYTSGATPGTFANIDSESGSTVITNIFAGTNYFRALVSGTLCPSVASSTSTVYTLVRPTCSIAGPNPVCAGTTNDYTVTSSNPTDTYGWTISSVAADCATLDTTTGPTVAVNSDSCTSYTLVATVTGTNGCVRICTNAAVTVNTVVPAVAALATENFGTSAGAIPPPTGWSVTELLTWSNSTASASSGYTGASGGANAIIGPGSNNASLLTPVINFTGLTSGVLTFGARRTAAMLTNVVVEVSTNNGTAFDAFSETLTTGVVANDANWHMTTVSLGSAIDGFSQVQIRFRLGGGFTSASNFRLDDVKLSGTVPSAAISPSGTALRCTGVPTTLTATLGSSWLWSPDGETTQSILATNSGAYTVTITYDNGCPATSSATTLTDCTGPSLTCPSDITTNSLVAVNVTYTDPTPSGNCAGLTNSCVPASGSSFDPGTNTVTCTASDDCGNSTNCTFKVIVNAVCNISLTCPSDIVDTIAGCSSVETWSPLTPTADCSVVTNYCSPASGSTFSVGTNTVNCTAKDTQDNVANCSFKVIIVTTSTPSFSFCPGDITTGTDSGTCTDKVVTFSPTATGCGVGIVCVPASGSTFQEGTTPVNCTATDTQGATALCSFNVIVNHLKTLPTFTCSDIITNITPSCTVILGWATNATANCGAVLKGAPACTPKPFTVFKTGTTPVTCKAIDNRMNTNVCSFTVTVLNLDPLTYSWFPTNITLVTCSNKSYSFKPIVAVADLCLVSDSKILTTNYCVPPSKTWFNQGTTTVNCYAQDKSGVTLSSNFVVTVADNVKPTIKPKVKGECIVQACDGVLSYTPPVYTDKCQVALGPVTVVCSPTNNLSTNSTTFVVGAKATSNLVTCTVTDGSGNQASTNWWIITNRRLTPKWNAGGSGLGGNDLCAIVDTDAEPTNTITVGITGGVTNVTHNWVKLYDLDNNDVTSDADVTGAVVSITFNLRTQVSPSSSTSNAMITPLVPKVKLPFTPVAGIGKAGNDVKPVGTMVYVGGATNAFVFDCITTNAGWTANSNTSGDATFIRATVTVTPPKPLCTKSVVGTGEIRLETSP